MSKAYEEMKKAEQHIINACDCQNRCAECPMNFSTERCVLSELRAAIKIQSIYDLRAEAYGEVL
jgi:hypothetical protein